MNHVLISFSLFVIHALDNLFFSQCSKSCGVGYQRRDVFCEMENGEKVTENECDIKEKPVERRKCFDKSCELSAKLAHDKPRRDLETNRWIIGSWSEVRLHE